MPAVGYRPSYTIENYLHWEGDWELWDGIPVSMSPPPNFFHQSVSGNLYAQLRALLSSESCPDNCEALYEIDWHVDGNTVVRPDLMVVCERPGGQWIEKCPEFVVEILSPSTRHKDLVAKRDLYAANVVQHYFIVDSDERSATLLVLGEDGSYLEKAADSPFEIHPGCLIRLEIPALFV